MNNNIPICLVPWKSILIDTNKDIKPCCAFNGVLGNLNKNTIKEITSGPLWTDTKNQLANQEWPKPCLDCKEQEEKLNHSVRMNYRENIKFSDDDKINYLEFNGSNICNLACLHCSPKFSSKWTSEWEKLEKILPLGILDSNKNIMPQSNFLTNPDLVVKNLKELDLSGLIHLVFKGGDPMLNDETVSILKHFDDISVLNQLEIIIFTNGTIVNEELLKLLDKTKKVLIVVSIDGIGKLNEYIRYGNNSHTDQLKKNIKIFKSFIKNIEITISCSTMVYNIFNLLEIRKFWIDELLQDSTFTPYFHIIVSDPSYINICVLSDGTRSKLIKYYKAHQHKNEFDIIIKALSGNYLGDEIHNNWVRYTEEMEKLRGNSIVELVPELKEELQYR